VGAQIRTAGPTGGETVMSNYHVSDKLIKNKLILWVFIVA